MKAEYISHMGDDLLVVNAARVSFAKESEWLEGQDIFVTARGTFFWDGYGYVEITEGEVEQKLKERDAKLISYLAKHNHWTPFSHPQITLRETVPIFVARQRFKHVVGFTYNEVSRRYVDDEPEFYVPKTWRSRPDGSVKQGSGDNLSSEQGFGGSVASPAEVAGYVYLHALKACQKVYNELLAVGVAPEQARMVLPQSMYTSYYVTGSLAAFARAYKQRIDNHAQQEIQLLAKQWDDIIRPLFPVSWEALTNEQDVSQKQSKQQTQKEMSNGEQLSVVFE